MNVKSTAKSVKHGISKHKPTAEELKGWHFNKWLRLHRKDVNDKAKDRLFVIGHTFNNQPKELKLV